VPTSRLYTLRERAVYLAYAVGWSFVRRLPERAAYALFEAVADLLWRRRGRGVRRLEANLSRVVTGLDEPALRELSRAGMRSYLRYWCDTFRLPDWDADRLCARIEVVGEHHLRDGTAGRGFVAALAHMGNWDHAGAWSCVTGTPVTTVAERLRPERLFERFVAFRTSLGMEVLPLTGSDRDVLRSLAHAARNGRAVCLLADRDLTGTGVEVDFFGGRTRMPGGPAVLALHTGAGLHPVTSRYAGATMVLHIGDAVEVPSSGTTREKVQVMMQAVADAFAAAIVADPQDWHMLQRVWTDEHAPAPVPGPSR
jgi:KDO2-lipid IV(A) lauroyltransferase